MKVIKQQLCPDITIIKDRALSIALKQDNGGDRYDVIFIERTKLQELISYLKELEKEK